jgi:antibiotic biosynthesis monooxygenase (ABM) superfamily enzyme
MSNQSTTQQSDTVHITKLGMSTGDVSEHVDWLARLMMVGVEDASVLSAEIIPPTAPDSHEWLLVQRFHNSELLASWRTSAARRRLIDELQPRVDKNEVVLSESIDTRYGTIGTVAVAIVTQVKPGQEATYCHCEGMFQSAQAKRPGYRGVYLQPPTKSTPGMWTTIIRFDSPAALDQWFSSEERKSLLAQSDPVVHSTDYQTMTTSFPGWYSAKETGQQGPPNWKTALLILLGLYPIVMIEIRHLSPALSALNPAMSNFIGNVISVALTTWVTMPLAIKLFNKWLFPTKDTPKWIEPASVGAMVCIYALEIALLWR